jgi:hypothetical protein
MERFRAAEEPSLPLVLPPAPPVLSVASVPIVELSFTSASGIFVSIVGRIVGMVLGMVLGAVGLLVGIVAGSLLLQPQAAQAIHTMAAAKIAMIRFIENLLK